MVRDAWVLSERGQPAEGSSQFDRGLAAWQATGMAFHLPEFLAVWAEWQAAYLVHKVWHGDPRRAGGYDIVKMAVTNNAALAGVFWPEAPLGEISPGACADLILVDYHPFTELTAGNLPWHILFGFEASAVTATMVAGKWLMRDRKLLTLDEEAIAARARELSAAVWQRYLELDE